MASLITVCITCKRPDWPERGTKETDGETFADLIEAAARERPEVAVRRHACLMGCAHGCNLSIQDLRPGGEKLTYVLGRFEPTREAAEAVVEYAALHAAADSGQVPFRQWPAAVKGHFVSRIPPVPAAPGDNGTDTAP